MRPILGGTLIILETILLLQGLGVTIDAHFDYHDSITITETTITILSISWHTIMILSRYYQVFLTMILKHGKE